MQLLVASMAGDGEKFARRLHQRQRDLRVLCISNHDFKMPLKWLPAGRQACIDKPYALSELLHLVRRMKIPVSR